jgi:hypothetical protein
VLESVVPGEDDDMSARGWLYRIARLMGDANAVKKGKVGRRVARRAAGKVAGRGMRKLLG